MSKKYKMCRLLIWLYFLTFLVPVTPDPCTGETFAKFRRTTIINDNCDYSLKLGNQSFTFSYCALWCAQKDRCRRFLHSENSVLCMLYSDGTNCVVDGDAAGYRCFVKSLGFVNDKYTCPVGYYGNQCSQIATDCEDFRGKGFEMEHNVLTNIHPPTFPSPFEVPCWLGNMAAMTIHHRDDTCNTVNFNRSMHEYEVGFGNVPWNGWLGFDKILPVVNRHGKQTRLEIYLKYNQDVWCSIQYSPFHIGNQASRYTFNAPGFAPIAFANCGDSIKGSNGTLNVSFRPFSTYDKDLTGASQCPVRLGGGWWFAADNRCTDSFLTGSNMTENYWRNVLQNKYISRIILKVSYY